MYATYVSALAVTATRVPTGAVNIYFVADGGDMLLVDPVARTDRLDDFVVCEGVGHLTVTHIHTDHVGTVAVYARETGATIWCHRGREHVFLVTTGVDPNRTFAEGTTIPVGVSTEILDTSGHTHGHMSFIAGGDMLYGDLAVVEGSVVMDAPEGDVRAYLAALRRLHARGPERLRPSYGPEITDPRATLARPVAHRNGRKRTVLDAVRAGNVAPDTVTDTACDKGVSVVCDLARATIVAHIEKLAAERWVRWSPEAERVEPR